MEGLLEQGAIATPRSSSSKLYDKNGPFSLRTARSASWGRVSLWLCSAVRLASWRAWSCPKGSEYDQIGGKDYNKVLYALKKASGLDRADSTIRTKLQELRTSIARILADPTFPSVSAATETPDMVLPTSYLGSTYIRDVVLDSLAFNADTLKGVASSETLDRVATNAIGLRLEDQALAEDVYTDLPRPTKGLHVQLNYDNAGIRWVNTLDYFAGTEQARVDHAPSSTPAKTVDVAFDGWIFPRSGVAFVWVLDEELSQSGK